jgi:RNA polymerase sigma-70 factor (ECF subfamily)
VNDAVGRAQAGDQAAFEELYRDHVGRVYALCLRMTADAGRAEELAQDAFLRAWTKLSTFRGDAAFSTWLHRLTVNVVLADRRSQGKRWARLMGTDELEPYEGAAARAAGAGAGNPSRGARLDLEGAIATLPDGARKVFVLYEIEGYRHEEIAQATGTAVGTSKAQLHRARKLLREALQA